MNTISQSTFNIQKWNLIRLYAANKNLKLFAKQRGKTCPYSWRLYVQVEGYPAPGVFSTDTRKTREWRTLDSLVRFVNTTLPDIECFEVIMDNKKGEGHEKSAA